MKKLKISVLLIAIGIFETVKAESIQFENVRVGGVGCPSEKTAITYAPDNSTASVIFQDFVSHVPVVVTRPKEVATISHLPCNLFLDVKLPVGHKLDSLEIQFDMRGNTILDRGVSGQFKSFLMKAMGMGTERTRGRSPELISEKLWINSLDEQFEDFVITSLKSINFNSECRTSSSSDRVSIHLQHHIMTQIQRGFESSGAEGTITMDSSDFSGGVKLKATSSPCSNNSGGGSSTPGRVCRQVIINGRVQMICR
jgi:hypothetical protein